MAGIYLKVDLNSYLLSFKERRYRRKRGAQPLSQIFPLFCSKEVQDSSFTSW
jgi:hypothetical protein